MALKAAGYVIVLEEGKLLIVGDSVVFSKRREVVTHLPTRLIGWSVLFEQWPESRGNNLACRFADPFLPAKCSLST